jgi:hypothetical protein
MSNRVDNPLSWWEQWLLELLAKRPRINRIVVELVAEEEDDVDDERFEASLREQLEWTFHGPDAERD